MFIPKDHPLGRKFGIRAVLCSSPEKIMTGEFGEGDAFPFSRFALNQRGVRLALLALLFKFAFKHRLLTKSQ